MSRTHGPIEEEHPDDPIGSADELAAQAGATAQLAQRAADRQRYGGAPGCDRCNATLPIHSNRVDLNAGLATGRHWRLCLDCLIELTDWLDNPPFASPPPRDRLPNPIPRSRHQ